MPPNVQVSDWRLPVASRTCPRHPSPIAVGLKEDAVVTGIPARELFIVVLWVRVHNHTFLTCGVA